MRLLFMTKSAPVLGGVESWLDDLVTGLAARGHDCLVALARGQRFHDCTRYAQQHPHLPWVALDGTRGSPACRRLAVRGALARHRPQVVLPVMLFDALLVSAATRDEFGHRIVYPVHEPVDGAAADLRTLGGSMDAAVAVDARTESLVRNAAPGLRCETIVCAIPTAPDPKPAREWPGCQPRIGWCGRMEQEAKRVQDAAPVLAGVRRTRADAELWTAGAGAGLDALERALSALGVAGAHHHLGALERGELASRLYAEIDVLLITSASETGPLVAFEAMASGVPVVCADFAGRAETGALRDGENCTLFPVGDTDAAARAVIGLLESPRRAAALRERAARWVREARGMPGMIDAWDALLHSVAESPPPAPRSAPRWAQLVPPGERLRELARVALGRRFEHTSLRAEWPLYGAP